MSDLERGFAAQARALREFGYPDVTTAMIAEAHSVWVSGEKPKGVIALMSVSAFKEYPDIFGTPTTGDHNATD